MTRRDYIFIAESFLQARRVFADHPENDCNPALREAALAGIDYAVRIMANRLAAANPRFDRARFMEYVGVK